MLEVQMLVYKCQIIPSEIRYRKGYFISIITHSYMPRTNYTRQEMIVFHLSARKRALFHSIFCLSLPPSIFFVLIQDAQVYPVHCSKGSRIDVLYAPLFQFPCSITISKIINFAACIYIARGPFHIKKTNYSSE